MENLVDSYNGDNYNANKYSSDKYKSDQYNETELMSNFKSVLADAEALLTATANTSGEKIAEIRAKVEESINVVKNSMLEAQDEVLFRTREAANATDTYVHENPWRSIGFAASLGIVVGLLIGRR